MTQDTTTTSGAADLIAAAQAVVDRWDTPLWKDVPATAEYIGRLRAALAAGQATAAQQEAAYAALPEYGINTASHAHFRVLGFTADQMHAFADATHALRASHGQAPAQPDPAYSAACNLATALFKKHFAHLPDYASGQVVWGLFDSTEGVILQIDNMVAGLVQPPTTSPQADSVQEDAGVVKLEQVHGDVLPPVGSRVFIRHGRDDDAHSCIVTGYYAWGDLQGDKRLHRVFVRMVYEGTSTEQARMLCDCYPTAGAALAPKPAPTPQASHGQAPAHQVEPSITLDFKQASELLEMFGGDTGLVTLQHGGEKCHSGPGLYAWYSDLPEEGAEFLGAEPDGDATPAPSAQQPAPSAAVALSGDLRDRLVAISEAIADQDDRAAQAMLREILKAPQAVMAADAISGAAAPAQDYPPLPMQFACSGVFPVYSADQMRAYVDADRAARATADSVQEDAARLDWLDQQCEAYGFQDIHEGNRWEISGPYANVRVAIDAERAASKQGANHDR